MIQDAAARVLIVEDEGDIASLMQAVLEDAGYIVVVHPNGNCFNVVERFRPDVILCDYMLPVYDGQTVLHKLRHEAELNMPVILISAMKSACESWRTWGADDFLPKPFDIDRLVAVVDRAVQEDVRVWSAKAVVKDERAS